MKHLTRAERNKILSDMDYYPRNMTIEADEDVQDTQYFNALDQQAEEATINSIVSQATV